MSTLSNGYLGYNISEASGTKNIIENQQEFLNTYSKPIKDVIEIFKGCSVKELEKSSTIIYLYYNYKRQGKDYSIDAVSADVSKIKPHFSTSEISQDYIWLQRQGLIS